MSIQYEKYQHIESTGKFSDISLLLLLTPLALYSDLFIFKDNVGELSATEIIQEFFLFISAVLFFAAAKKQNASSGFHILVSGFFSCLLIRELDFLFDFVWHGFWVVPAALTTLFTISYSLIRHSKSIWKPLFNYIKSPGFKTMLFGLIMVMILSRILGSGKLLWEPLLGENANSFLLKTTIQEGLELVGYTFIVYASYQHFRRVSLK